MRPGNLTVGKTQNLVTSSLKPTRSRGIIGRLSIVSVLVAVELNDQFCCWTEKIDDIRADWLLSPEAHAFDLLAAQAAPELLFRVCRRRT